MIAKKKKNYIYKHYIEWIGVKKSKMNRLIFLHGPPYYFLLNWEEREREEKVLMVRLINEVLYIYIYIYFFSFFSIFVQTKQVKGKILSFLFSFLSPLLLLFPFSLPCFCQTLAFVFYLFAKSFLLFFSVFIFLVFLGSK